MQKIKTGTTILAIKYKGGILVASDLQVTQHYFKTKITTQYAKLERINDSFYVLISGGVISCLQFVSQLRNFVEYYEKTRNCKLNNHEI